MGRTKELHFEDAIQHHLITSGGWAKDSAQDFERKTALVAKDFFGFVETAQPETWTKVCKQLHSNQEAAVLDMLVKALDAEGTHHAREAGQGGTGDIESCIRWLGDFAQVRPKRYEANEW